MMTRRNEGRTVSRALTLSAAVLCSVWWVPARAQTADQADGAATAQDAGNESAPLAVDEILVTAQKKSRAERAQDVPIAITALGAAQIDKLKLVTLTDLASSAPNVTLENNGTFKGVAAFAIRGLGVNSSIPSIEPAVGTFIDGIYLGTNYGVVLDTFDLEGIEILRGPQGTLQGRNVTGGAVLVRTRRPGDSFSVRGQASVESGPLYTVAGSVEGPIVRDVLKAKLAGYYKKDEGWFKNQFTGDDAGKERTWFIRPTLVFTPTDNLETTLILERGRVRGDGLVVQNSADPTLTGFETNYNETGYSRVDWKSATSETTLNVGLGEGVITNLFGWRKVKQDSLTDADASVATYFHYFAYLNQKQWSDELRYAGTFGNLDITTGVYFFSQKFDYLERRILSGGAIDRVFGGSIDQHSLGLFTQGEWHITPTLSTTLGIRYSTERKDAVVNRSPTGTNPSNCDYVTKTCPYSFLPVFEDGRRWSAVTPKIGLNWKPAGNILVYANWSEGVRSGGYNVRSTSTTVPPGPYDPEDQQAFELGFKTDLLDRRLRFNGAVYLNKLDSLQRDVLLVAQPPETGTVQVVRNAVDADIYGAETEVNFVVDSALQLNANLGYTDSRFYNVQFDLSGDNVIDAADRRLKPPRLSRWTYNVGATYVRDIGKVEARANVDFGYRSRAASNDANTTFLSPRNLLNASLAFTWPDNAFELAFYGKNLLNEDLEGSQVLISRGVPPYTLRSIEKGRILGVSGKFRF